MKSPIYWSGRIYTRATRALHGLRLQQRYDYIQGFMSPGDRVLDLGCGTGDLQTHLHGNSYLGLELNDSFIAYARKKGRNVIKQDALTFNGFENFDLAVIVDLLHHVNPRHERFLQTVLSKVRKKTIVIEPYDVHGGNRFVKAFLHCMDSDGFNGNDGNWLERKELADFYARFKPTRVDEFGHSMAAVFDTEERGGG